MIAQQVTVSDASLDESGSNFAIVAATSLLLGVTRTSSEAYTIGYAVLFSVKNENPHLLSGDLKNYGLH